MPRIYVTTPPAQRFWKHVDKNGPVPPLHPSLGNCWLWTGSLDPQGYGHFWDGRRTAVGNPKPIYAHRFAFDGVIPPNMEVNHLCEVRACCRPSHLDLATRMANARYGNSKIAKKAAQTHCIHGHPFNEANTCIDPNGTRHCRQCSRDRSAKRWRNRSM